MSAPHINPNVMTFTKILLAKRLEPRMGLVGSCFLALFSLLSVFSITVTAQSAAGDAAVMQVLKKSLTLPASLDWSNSDPCQWTKIGCDPSRRVTRIQIGSQNVGGSLPLDIRNLSELQVFEVMNNHLVGEVPSLAGLVRLQVLNLRTNNFTSIPPDFFSGMSSLQAVYMDENRFSSWEIPDSLRNATALQNFSANSANVSGKIPDFFNANTFPGMIELHLAGNNLVGGLPSSFIGSPVQSLWLNNLHGNPNLLNGTIDVLANMTQLVEVWLHGNQFTAPIPDLSNLKNLQSLGLRDNDLTGVVPVSLLELPNLKILNLSNNNLQGPRPAFPKSVIVDMGVGNQFCLPTPNISCDPRVNILLSIAQPMGYPLRFAQEWGGNDPCSGWLGITCSSNGSITVINFPKMGLSGTISPDYSQITTLQRLILADNNLVGPIPSELTRLPNLQQLDVSNNNLSGKIPSFRSNLDVKTDGNPNIGKDIPLSPPGTPGAPGTTAPPSPGGEGSKKKSVGVIVGSLVGGIFGVALVGLLIFFLAKKRPTRSGKVRSPNNVMVVHPRDSGENGVKITVTAANANGSTSETHSHGSGGTGDIQVVEAGNMVISIEVLRKVTNNFSEDNILGKGGFGTVYKGELHDGTKIAVKRMESGVVAEKGLAEFKAEIAVLTKVRHRHLVSLLGYCLDGNERLLVYEYMPQGTFSRHLFNWREEGLKPLEWTRRLSIALDVARGVEYLHSLAHQTFIHRDLKPSNILLGDDMRAKVADFGLVRLAPEGKGSIETRLAGTFGYLAPEYAVTGRVTTKVDVFSFGVILMEMITGRKALDETQPEDSVHLATWFRRMHLNKDSFRKAIDPTIDCDEETLGSISTVAELACHCCAREPYQRPDMGHAVNVLSSLIELWKPSEPDADDIYGIDLDMTLPQALKKWQQFEGSNVDESSSSYVPSEENTQTSIPNRPPGFASSFTSTDGR